MGIGLGLGIRIWSLGFSFDIVFEVVGRFVKKLFRLLVVRFGFRV